MRKSGFLYETYRQVSLSFRSFRRHAINCQQRRVTSLLPTSTFLKFLATWKFHSNSPEKNFRCFGNLWCTSYHSDTDLIEPLMCIDFQEGIGQFYYWLYWFAASAKTSHHQQLRHICQLATMYFNVRKRINKQKQWQHTIKPLNINASSYLNYYNL